MKNNTSKEHRMIDKEGKREHATKRNDDQYENPRIWKDMKIVFVLKTATSVHGKYQNTTTSSSATRRFIVNI